ncbi:oxidoreductase [Paenibacillus pini JCM 16418]|uniref:Oxidoreductase n=1 Tax=Paenibacillus pini JCM 16418 TaxID=1236976 RepID=W7Z5K8_9BACL|nr:hypothetical protein [Paenibacillus pini]GAF09579.1 oxidoreductase [Paenibacillus pini JCM 16418]
MHIARISVAPDSFLTDMYAINYQVDPSLDLEHNDKLKTHESGVLPSKLLFHLNRASDTGKNMFWNLQKKYFTYQEDAIISRNNAMRPESSFMEYHEAGANDLLQEYFVPVDEFASFVEDLKSVLKDAGDKVNLLNITVRYVPRNQDVVLSYAKEDMLALVCLFNTSLSKEGHAEMKQTVRNIVDQVLRHRGTYYLPYAAYPSVEQFREAYPGYNTFFKAKDQFDPDHIFMNYFYEQYKGE